MKLRLKQILRQILRIENMAAKRARHLSHSRGKAKAAAESYSHMMGSPQDPASVGMNQMPSPQGRSI